MKNIYSYRISDQLIDQSQKMSATIRDFTNFKEFPGEVVENVYCFPKLYKKATTGKVREWQIFIRLIKEDSKIENQDVNWNLFDEIEVPIKKTYFEERLPEGILCEYYTETGFVGMKITRSVAVYTKEKNVGRANARNAFQSALIECRAKYLKKVEEGSSTEVPSSTPKKLISSEKMYFPMLAKNYKDLVNKVEYPIYIQPKLDGVRCVAFMKKDSIILYSRQKKEYPDSTSNKNIKEFLKPVFDSFAEKFPQEQLYLDGELYMHGKTLQELNSITRGSTNNEKCQYWIFDCFNPNKLNEPFSQRIKTLKSLFSEVSSEKVENPIKLVPTHFVTTKKENDTLYQDYLKQNYEGVIIRNRNGVYAAAEGKNSASRSSDLLKRKEVFDEEFEVVDFTEGKSGKEVGAIIWICQTVEGKRFNVVPNIPYKERYSIYKKASSKGGFDKLYANRMLTVEFRGWSDDKIPLQAKAISFRDYL